MKKKPSNHASYGESVSAMRMTASDPVSASTVRFSRDGCFCAVKLAEMTSASDRVQAYLHFPPCSTADVDVRRVTLLRCSFELASAIDPDALFIGKHNRSTLRRNPSFRLAHPSADVEYLPAYSACLPSSTAQPIALPPPQYAPRPKGEAQAFYINAFLPIQRLGSVLIVTTTTTTTTATNDSSHRYHHHYNVYLHFPDDSLATQSSLTMAVVMRKVIKYIRNHIAKEDTQRWARSLLRIKSYLCRSSTHSHFISNPTTPVSLPQTAAFTLLATDSTPNQQKLPLVSKRAMSISHIIRSPISSHRQTKTTTNNSTFSIHFHVHINDTAKRLTLKRMNVPPSYNSTISSNTTTDSNLYPTITYTVTQDMARQVVHELKEGLNRV